MTFNNYRKHVPFYPMSEHTKDKLQKRVDEAVERGAEQVSDLIPVKGYYGDVTWKVKMKSKPPTN